MNPGAGAVAVALLAAAGLLTVIAVRGTYLPTGRAILSGAGSSTTAGAAKGG